MEWRPEYLDAVLVPLGVIMLLTYQATLYAKVKSNPLETVIGLNHVGRRQWVHSIMKDNEKKNILAVQTLRNTIMGSTLMASTAILLSSALAAFITSTYFNNKKPFLSGESENLVSVKYMSLLLCFLFSFGCYMQSVRYVNHVNFLINIPLKDAMTARISPDYVANVLAKGCNFFSIGTRGFYLSLPLLLWLFGPVPVVVCSAALVPAMYYLDTVEHDDQLSLDCEGKISAANSSLELISYQERSAAGYNL